VCGKQVYFWNWKKEAYHLVMRYKRDYNDLFKFGESISEIAAQQLKLSDQSPLTEIASDE
jgi:hypothetical protein